MKKSNLEHQLSSLPTLKPSRFATLKLTLKLWIQLLRSASWVRILATLGITGALLGSFGSYAYASPKVTHGSFLYPVKQAIEQVRVITATSDADIANVYADLADRRREEAKWLEEVNNTTALQETLEDLEEVNTVIESYSTEDIELSPEPPVEESVDEAVEELPEEVEFSSTDVDEVLLEEEFFEDEVEFLEDLTDEELEELEELEEEFFDDEYYEEDFDEEDFDEDYEDDWDDYEDYDDEDFEDWDEYEEEEDDEWYEIWGEDDWDEELDDDEYYEDEFFEDDWDEEFDDYDDWYEL